MNFQALGLQCLKVEAVGLDPGHFPQPQPQADLPGVAAPGRIFVKQFRRVIAPFRQPLPRLGVVNGRRTVGRPGVHGIRHFRKPEPGQVILNRVVGSPVKHRRHRPEVQPPGRPAQMRLQHLPQVHPGRNADGVENHIHRSAVRQIGHILLSQDAGHHALVAVAAGHLVPHRNLARLGNPHPHRLADPRRQVILLLPAQDFHIDDLAPLPVRHPQGSILHIPRLFPENGPQQLLLSGQLSLPLRRNLAHQNIPRPHIRAGADDAPLVQIPQAGFPHIGNIPGDFLRPQLGLSGLHFVLLNVNRGKAVVPHQPLADDDGVLVVVAFPGHKGHQHILPQSQFAPIGRGAVRQGITLPYPVARLHDGPLVKAGALIGAGKLHQGMGVFLPGGVSNHDYNFFSLFLPGNAGNRSHHAIRLRQHHLAAVPRHLVLNAGADHRNLRPQQRHRLPLHIRPHQSPVGVIMLQKRNQRRRDAHNLHRRHIHIIHQLRGLLAVILPPAHFHPVILKLPQPIQPGIGLGHVVVFLLIGRQINHAARVRGDIRLYLQQSTGRQRLNGPHPVAADDLPLSYQSLAAFILHRFGNLPPLQIRSRVLDGFPNLAVRRFNKPVPVHIGVGTQGTEQADVRPFRRLDGADAPVVGKMHIPHIKPGPLPG